MRQLIFEGSRNSAKTNVVRPLADLRDDRHERRQHRDRIKLPRREELQMEADHMSLAHTEKTAMQPTPNNNKNNPVKYDR